MTDETVELTRLLRYDSNPFWKRLRVLLNDKGFDVESCFLAESCEQGDNSEFGVVVTRDKEVFEYGFIYQKDPSDGNFGEWNDITQTYSSSPYADSVNIIFSRIEQSTDG